MNRVFGSAGQRIGQRIFLRLLEHDRVVDDRGGLLGDAVEQAAVIVGVDRRLGVVDRDRADEALVEQQRADQRRVQRRAIGREAGRLEIGARPRVDERPAVARHPAGQAVAVADRQLLDRLGFDAGREPAAQRFGFVVVEEQRAARERHDVAQLRRDQRHRVGHAEAAAHRLRDLVERVDLAVRERDVLEDVGAAADVSSTRPTAGAAVGACVGDARQLARRLGAGVGLGRQRRVHLDEGLHHARVERLARSPAAAARSRRRGSSPCGTAAPTSARRSSRRPTGCARRAESRRPSSRRGSPCRPSARGG